MMEEGGNMSQRIVYGYVFDDQRDIIKKTDNSILYSARKLNADSKLDILKYAIKEYVGGAKNDELISREKDISHTIENDSENSIIVPILEVIEEHGTTYAIMQFRKNGMFLYELIDALEEKYGEGNIPYGIQYEIMRSLLTALDFLHNIKDRYTKRRSNGYLHMDIQPSNIFFENTQVVITPTDSVKSDREVIIGAAKFIDLQSAISLNASQEELVAYRKESDPAFVTYGYSAPEQIYYNGHSYTEATDIYQVAAVGARMLTGRELSYLDTGYEDVLKSMRNNLAHEDKTWDFTNLVATLYTRVLLICFDANVRYRYQSALSLLDALTSIKLLYDGITRPTRDIYSVLRVAHNMGIALEHISLDNITPKEFENAATKLNKKTYEYAYAKDKSKTEFSPSMGAYVFRGLYKHWQRKLMNGYINNEPTNKITDMVYNLFLNGGIGCYNMVGDYAEAIKLWELVDLKRIELDTYVKLCNRVIESYTKNFCYQEAYEVSQKIVDVLQAVKDAKKTQGELLGLDGEFATKDVNLGRAYFNMGQTINYYGVVSSKYSNKEALDMFVRSCEELKGNVQSEPEAYYHALHYAIYVKDGALFDNMANEYEKLLNKRLREADIKKGDILPYLIYLKGLQSYISDADFRQGCSYYSEFVLDTDDGCIANDMTIEKLVTVVKEYDKNNIKLRDTNCQLVYKYIGEILYDSSVADEGIKDIAIDAMNLSVSCNKLANVKNSRKLNMPSIIAYISSHKMNLMKEKSSLADKLNKELYTRLLEAIDNSSYNNLKLLLKNVKASSCIDLCKLIPYEDV